MTTITKIDKEYALIEHGLWERLCISNGKCSTKEGDVAKAKELLKKETKETIDQVLMIIYIDDKLNGFDRETKAYDVFIADVWKKIIGIFCK